MPYSMKVVVVMAFNIITWPAWGLALADQWLFRSERAFDFFAKLLSLVPGRIGQYLRASFYVRTLARCPYDLMVGFGSFFSHPTAAVGRRVSIASFSIIGTATLGDGVMISSRVSVLSGKHHHGDGSTGPGSAERHVRYERVTVGRGTWIGEGAVIMADVGERCIVSAGSVVTKVVPPHTTAVGNPARFVKRDPAPVVEPEVGKVGLSVHTAHG
ncbi:MAG: acyltransferase [Acidiferrobacteraceae bacterium]